MNRQDHFVLSNGVSVPSPGFGTYHMEDTPETISAVAQALAQGYRHIDTAAYYNNEAQVGRAIRASGLAREEIFVTSKVWNTDRGYESTKAAFQKTLDNLGLDYLDLYLIHWPATAHRFENWQEINAETWRAMTELCQAGKIRAIGVSNFKPHHLRPLLEGPVKPMVNQIEFHPGCQQEETLAFCQAQGILVEAWGPLSRGKILDHALLGEIAQKHGKSPAQVCLRWCLEKGVLPLPKSVTPGRMAENRAIFDFALDGEDLARLAALPPVGGSGHDPDRVDF